MPPGWRNATTSKTSTGSAAGPDRRKAYADMATTFKYSVRDRAGKLQSGTLEADSQAMVATRLKGMGYAPLSIAETDNTGMSRELKIPGFGTKVKLKDLAVFSRQFATMINSGLSLLRALTILCEQTDNKELTRVLRVVRSCLLYTSD